MTKSVPTEPEPTTKDPQILLPESGEDILYIGNDTGSEMPPVRLYKAEVVGERVEIVPRRTWPATTWHVLGSSCEWLFGVISLMVGLAVLATLPILQLLSLGYLLEVSGRISRSGRIRDGFVGVRKAARVGSLVAGTWLVLLPLRFLSDYWYSAHLIDPNSNVARGLRIALVVFTVLFVAHILWAWYRGGKFRHFFWPAPVKFVKWLSTGKKYSRARDAVWDFVVSLHLPYYFWLGVRGFAGAVAWLVIPVLFFIGSTKLEQGPAAAIVGIFGALLFGTVLLYLPFLQAHFAAERRMKAMFELGRVRQQFRRAPIAYWFALVITLLFAIPLYLLKIEATPEEVVWLPSLVFVAFIFPARVITGWAVGRGRKQKLPRHFLFRWMSRLAAVPVIAFYLLVVYLTQFIAWNGAWNVFEQHAFLVPVPFLGL